MNPILNIALMAARNASKIILRSLDKLDTINVAEKANNDFVTEVDQASEREIISTILKAYPDHAILGEESGMQGSSDYVWIIDPLDGTLNFIHGHPHFSIAIAVKHKNKIEHGLVYDPLRDELFSASNGSGAFLNNRRIRIGSRKTFNGASIGTGFGHGKHENIEPHLSILRELMPHVAGIRRSGSAALDLAYVAAGRIDGSWEIGLKPWDIAAGSLIIREAGGLVSDFEGRENYLESGNIVSANPKLFKLLLQAIKKALV
jgi:myo-inositol-1(or 4)-monophosphatase